MARVAIDERIEIMMSHDETHAQLTAQATLVGKVGHRCTLLWQRWPGTVTLMLENLVIRGMSVKSPRNSDGCFPLNGLVRDGRLSMRTGLFRQTNHWPLNHRTVGTDMS
jgi:hypothetical protein